MDLAQGFLFPTSSNTDGSATPVDFTWTNEGNILSTNASVASATTTLYSGTGLLTDKLQGSDFKFAIPTGATITAVDITIRCRYTLAAGSVSSMVVAAQLETAGSAISGALNSAALPVTTLTDTNISLTGAALANLTPAILNASTFGVAITCGVNGTATGATITVEVDSVKIKVTYTPSDGGPPLTTNLQIFHWSDAVVGTTPITHIRDQSGNARDFVPASSFRGADLIAADTLGPARIAFNHDPNLGAYPGDPNWGGPQTEANTSCYDYTSSALSNANWTVYLILRPRVSMCVDGSGTAKLQALIYGTDGANAGLRIGISNGAFQVTNPNAGAGQTFNASSSPATPRLTTGFQVACIRGDGNRLKITVNGRTYDSGAGARSTSGQTQNIRLGCQGPAGSSFANFFAGDLVGLLWFTSAHSDNEVASMISWAQGRCPPTSEKRIIVCEGDSNTMGQVTPNHDTWPSLSVACRRYGYANIAQSGGHMSTGIASLTAVNRINQTASPNKIAVVDGLISITSQNWLVVAVGLNDTRANRSGVAPDSVTDVDCANTIYGEILTYIAARKAAGHDRIFVCHVTDNNGNGSGTDNANFVSNTKARNRKNLLNALIDQGAAANGYTVIPWGRDRRIGVDGASANTTYFNSDQLHFTRAGALVRAQIFDEIVFGQGGWLSRNKVRARMSRGR